MALVVLSFPIQSSPWEFAIALRHFRLEWCLNWSFYCKARSLEEFEKKKKCDLWPSLPCSHRHGSRPPATPAAPVTLLNRSRCYPVAIPCLWPCPTTANQWAKRKKELLFYVCTKLVSVSHDLIQTASGQGPIIFLALSWSDVQQT